MIFKAKNPIGLDIGSSTVKALQMKKTSRGVTLERFGMAEIFPSGQKKKDPEAVRQATVNAIKKALAAGIAPRVEVASFEQTKPYLDMGVEHFCIGWDLGIIAAWCREQGLGMKSLLNPG